MFDAQRAGDLIGRLDVVTFDLWATVLGSPRTGGMARHTYRVRAFSEALNEMGHQPSADEITALMKRDWQRFERVWDEDQRTLLNRERVDWMVDALGLPPMPDAIADGVAVSFDESIWEGVPGIAPGIHALLETLTDRGVRLGVISDTSYSTGQTLRKVLAREGLAEFFEVFTFSDEAGRSKPDVEVFRLTLAAFDATPERAAHIGDNPRTDVRGALDSGMAAVLYHPDSSTPPLDPEPTLTVGHFDHLRDAWSHRKP